MSLTLNLALQDAAFAAIYSGRTDAQATITDGITGATVYSDALRINPYGLTVSITESDVPGTSDYMVSISNVPVTYVPGVLTVTFSTLLDPGFRPVTIDLGPAFAAAYLLYVAATPSLTLAIQDAQFAAPRLRLARIDAAFSSAYGGRSDAACTITDGITGAIVYSDTLLINLYGLAVSVSESDSTGQADYFVSISNVPASWVPGTLTVAFSTLSDPGFRPFTLNLGPAFTTAYLQYVAAAADVLYATTESVQAFFPTQILTIGLLSQPSASTVTAWISDASRWIDATLRWRYVTPIKDVADIAILSPICAGLVASRIWSVLGGHSKEMPGNGPALRAAALADLAYDPKCGRSSLSLPSTLLTGDEDVAIGIPVTTFTDPSRTDNPNVQVRLFSMMTDL